MAGRRGEGAAPQHHLIGHELAVVFGGRARRGLEARIGGIGAGGPLPDLARQVGEGVALRRGGMLPLRLGRQALSGPTRIGVGFVETDVAHRGGRIDGRAAGQPHHGPVLAVAPPVVRRDPALGLHHRPAVRQPQIGAPIAVVGHEPQPVAVRHQIGGQGERLQPDPVRRAFVVECEIRPVVTDGDQTAVEGHDAAARRLKRLRARFDLIASRIQRRARQQVQNIHQEQLLMLLVVMQAQFQQIAMLTARRRLGQPVDHATVDFAAIGQHLVDGRPGHQATLMTRHPLAQRLVVGIEQLLEPRIDRPIGRVVAQDHRLEEPTGMGQMPLAGATIRHGLGRQVLGRQTLRQIDHDCTHGSVTRHVRRNPRIGFKARIHAGRSVARPLDDPDSTPCRSLIVPTPSTSQGSQPIGQKRLSVSAPGVPHVWRIPAVRWCGCEPRPGRRRCAGCAPRHTARPEACRPTPRPRRTPGWRRR